MMKNIDVDFISPMVGVIMVSVTGNEQYSDRLTFTDSNGIEYTFCHFQDCCESVRIEDIVGDVNDLIGSPIVEASVTSSSGPEGYESSTWTFYRFSTVKGTVTVRWLGTSNGYYSERVNFGMNPECGHPGCEDECAIQQVMTE